jgi:8-oxo-dGTP diphosphatase
MRHTARAIIIRDKRILMVTGHGADYYWTPGGGIDEGESIIDALHREIKEELGVSVVSAKHYMSYEVEYADQKATNFIVDINESIILSNEITNMRWLSAQDYHDGTVKLSVGFETMLLPRLIADKLL